MEQGGPHWPLSLDKELLIVVDYYKIQNNFSLRMCPLIGHPCFTIHACVQGKIRLSDFCEFKIKYQVVKELGL